MLRMIGDILHVRTGTALFLEQHARYTGELAIGGVLQMPLCNLLRDTERKNDVGSPSIRIT